jgi:hypothetical protein
MSNHRSTAGGLATLIFLGVVLAGCAAPGGEGRPKLAMAPLHLMHAEVQTAPVAVQEAYQFAVANPETLAEIPCYCGCQALGHKSNYDCYVAGQDAGGAVMFDAHALACQMCVDITQDTMRLLREGRSVPEVYKHVNRTYARFGPATLP